MPVTPELPAFLYSSIMCSCHFTMSIHVYLHPGFTVIHNWAHKLCVTQRFNSALLNSPARFSSKNFCHRLNHSNINTYRSVFGFSITSFSAVAYSQTFRNCAIYKIRLSKERRSCENLFNSADIYSVLLTAMQRANGKQR